MSNTGDYTERAVMVENVSDELENPLASEQIERRRLTRLIDALPVLAGFISPDGHVLHTVGPNKQTFIWDMPEFAYSHDSVTSIIDLCDRAARGERIQIERPYRKNRPGKKDIILTRGLLTFEPMRDEDGEINDIAINLIDCEDYDIPIAKPLEKSRLATANRRIESALSFAQMVIETLWENREHPSGSVSSRDRISERLDVIASIIDPLSDPDLNTVPLEILVDCVLSTFSDTPDNTRLKVLLPDADIPMDYAPLMALMLGELMNNAFEHGAWNDDGSMRRGHVCIEADQFDGPQGSYLRIDWTEDGGPDVAMFNTKGFGLTLCERLFPQITGGASTMTHLEAGICWTFELPIDDSFAEAEIRSRSPKLIYSDLQASDLPPEHDLDPSS